MHELVTASQFRRWDQILNLFNITDIFYSREYIASALRLDPGEALLFYYIDDEGEGEIIYPFIKRRLTKKGALYYDITSPFGYGGPVFKVKKDGYKLAASFLAAFSVYCRSEKIIAEYIRFHPLLHNAELLKDELKLIRVHDTYTLPLNFFDNGKMNDGSKGPLLERESPYSVKKLGTVKHMFDFLVLYYSSIRRNEEIDSYYFFTNDYFEALVSELGPNLHLFGTYKNNRLLAACYVLAKDDVIYHHLSGKLEQNEVSHAEAEMVEAIAKWGADNNYCYFHLTERQAASVSGMVAASIQEGNKLSSSPYFIALRVHDRKIYKTFQPIDEHELIKRYGNI